MSNQNLNIREYQIYTKSEILIHFDKADKLREEIRSAVYTSLGLFKDGNIQKSKLLEILQHIERDSKLKIKNLKLQAPFVAEADFKILGKLDNGNEVILDETNTPIHILDKITNKEQNNRRNKEHIDYYLFLCLDTIYNDLLNLISHTQNYPDDLKKEVSRQDILDTYNSFKNDGMKRTDIMDEINNWLIQDLGFTEKEVKKRFNIKITDPDSLARTVANNTSYHKLGKNRKR